MIAYFLSQARTDANIQYKIHCAFANALLSLLSPAVSLSWQNFKLYRPLQLLHQHNTDSSANMNYQTKCLKRDANLHKRYCNTDSQPPSKTTIA